VEGPFINCGAVFFRRVVVWGSSFPRGGFEETVLSKRPPKFFKGGVMKNPSLKFLKGCGGPSRKGFLEGGFYPLGAPHGGVFLQNLGFGLGYRGKKICAQREIREVFGEELLCLGNRGFLRLCSPKRFRKKTL